MSNATVKEEKVQGNHTVYPIVAAQTQEDGSQLMKPLAAGITIKQEFAIRCMAAILSNPANSLSTAGAASKAKEAANALIEALNEDIIIEPVLEPIADQTPVVESNEP